MDNLSTSSTEFARGISEVLESVGEIVALFRFHAGAGSRSYEFFESSESFFYRVDELSPQTSVEVFRMSQFPIRGITDDVLIAEAKSRIPDGTDWAVVRTSLITMGSQSWYHVFEDSAHDELENALRDEFCWGQSVAIGVVPDRLDRKSVLSAVKPHDDGRVERGIY